MATTTRTLSTGRDDPDPSVVDEAARVIRAGGLVAFATETVYGLGADATDPAAVARIFQAKGRPPVNPLIVHAADVGGAVACVADWPERAAVLAERFWPGPLTLVLPRATVIPDVVTAGRETVGVRVPGTAVARELIRRSGRPIAAPSANRSNRISPTEARHVLKDLGGRIDLIIDSGPTPVGLESTVLDLSGPRPRLLRPGMVGAAALEAALGEALAEGPSPAREDVALSSPGQMTVHYAPATPAYRVERDALGRLEWPVGGRWGLLMVGGEAPEAGQGAAVVRVLATPEVAAERLYATLHDLDEMGLDGLLIVPPAAGRAEWRAVRDRLERAARPWP